MTVCVCVSSDMSSAILQCLLDSEGATDLVVDLIIGNYSNRTFYETIELGIALLDGGNCTIQVTLSAVLLLLAVFACV